MRHLLVGLAAAPLLAACAARPAAVPVVAAAPSCSSPAAAAQVAGTIRQFFAALAVDDDAAVRRLTTPDFYAFEIGKRYSGAELTKIIADAHKSGRILQWNIGAVDARVDCTVAFAAWENRGATGTAGKLKPAAWLESALLLRQGDGWVIYFLHSTPKDPRP